MALKRKGSGIATSIIKNDDGFTTGIVGEITQEVITRQNQNKRGEIDEVDSEVIVIPITCETRGDKPIVIRVMTGTKINPDPLDTVRQGSKNVPVYNKFTTFLLRTDLMAESELENLSGNDNRLDEIWKNLDNFEGSKLKFKTVKNKDNFNDITISSIEVITD